MVVGAKVCELTDGFLWFVCGNFDVSPKKGNAVIYNYLQGIMITNTFHDKFCEFVLISRV